MQLEIYTNYQPTKIFRYPSFTARPLKVDWNSESGKLIEKTLAAMATTAVGLITIKNRFEEKYKQTKDSKIVDKHAQLYLDALKNQEQIRGGYIDVTNDDINDLIMDEKTINTLGIFGKGTLESAFALDYVGFENLCSDINVLRNYISDSNLELLKKKINPENTKEYRTLEEVVKRNKRKINELLGKDNIEQRKILMNEIEKLKTDSTNKQEIKKLKRQIQDIYYNSENFAQISSLMQAINQKQGEMKEILNQRVDLSPQEIIKKVWCMASMIQTYKYTNNVFFADCKLNLDENDVKKRKLNNDIRKYIELLKPSTPENDKAWSRFVNKQIYERLGYKYDDVLLEYIDFTKCKYVNELINSNEGFWRNLPDLVNMTLFPGLFENKEHNIATENIFKELGINYNNWSDYNEKSYIQKTITINKNDAKQKAVENMCQELTNDTFFKDIPENERNHFFESLKNIGIDIIEQNITIDNRAIEFEDLDKIIQVIRNEINNNSFWKVKCKNKKVELARDTLYNHFVFQRKQEIDNVKQLKDTEDINIKIRKANMRDIPFALGLGNYAHCCTALGAQSNEWSAPTYIMNHCISAIEIIADDKPVGNTMIYIAKVKKGKKEELALILDDIELQTKYQNNDRIRDMIVGYANNLCEEIGKPDMAIYAGPGMHKVDMSKYKLIKNAEMNIQGEIYSQNAGIYLDFMGDCNYIGDSFKTDLYKVC